MLSNCKIGDWVKFQHTNHYYCVGIVTDYSVKWNKFVIDWKATVYNGDYKYTDSKLQGLWHPNNCFINAYQPTMKELFKIKQLEEEI